MKKWTTFSNFNIPHGITNKYGGHSEGHFAFMNTAFYGEDDFYTVMKNLRQVLTWLDKPIRAVFATRQVHGAHIECVDYEANWNKYIKYSTEGSALQGIELYVVENCDGLITSREDVLLMTYYADCVPLVLWDPVHKVIGSAHSGWRGTTLEISKELVHAFVNGYNSDVKDLLAGIGHAAGACCYEVGEDVYQAFNKIFSKETCDTFFIKKDEKFLLDLKRAIALQWHQVGLREEQIEINGDCTICARDEGVFVYHSHRREGLKRGSMSAFITL